MHMHLSRLSANWVTAVFTGCLSLLYLGHGVRAGEPSPIVLVTFDSAPSGSSTAIALPVAKAGHIEYVDGVRGKAVRIFGTDSLALPEGAWRPASGTIAFWLRRTTNVNNGDPWPLRVLRTDPVGPAIWFDKLDVCNAAIADGAACRLPLVTDSDEAWNHYALKWEENGVVTLYRNGVADGKNAAKKTATTIAGKGTLRFTCGEGHPQRYIDLDEVKCFERALTSEEIAGLVRADRPVETELNHPPLRRRVIEIKAGEIPQTAFRFRALADLRAIFRLQTLDRHKKPVWTADIPTMLKQGEEKELTWQLPVPSTGATATIKAVLLNPDGSGPVWAMEIVCLPSMTGASPITRNPNSSLPTGSGEIFAKIDCTAVVDDNFLSSAPTEITQSLFGKYRSTPPGQFNWFAYRFKIKNPGRPHLVTITYPDDMTRIMAFDLCDGTGRPPQGAGVMTGGDELSGQRITNTMRTREVLFWPENADCGLFICNWRNDTPAAIAGFSVREYPASELESVQVPELPAGLSGREFGTYVEDASMPFYWGGAQRDGAGPEQWRITAENLASFFKYTGQNVYYYPIFWYSGALYPNRTDDFGFYDGVRGNYPDGSFDVVLSALARSGIKLMPTISLKWNAALAHQTEKLFAGKNDPNTRQRYRGENPAGDEILQVNYLGQTRKNWLGTNIPGGGNVGPMFNPLHPAVQKVTRELVEDWLKLYGQHPGMGGMAFDLSTQWEGCPGGESTGFEGLTGDYSDFTVGRFVKETGIAVPGTAGDPARFRARYDFLTAGTMREKWISWRCERIRDEVVLPLAKLVWQARPNLNVTLNFGAGKDIGSAELGKKRDWKTALRECGFDIDLYRSLPRMKIIYLSGYHVGYPQSNLADVMDPLLQGRPAGVIGYWSLYWEEYSKNTYQSSRKFWPEVQAWVCPVRVITEQDLFILRNGLFALARGDVQSLLVGGMGQNPWQGHQPEVTAFARAYRALPAVPFADVPGLEDPVRVRQWRNKEDTFVYLVNTEPYPVTVDLNLTSVVGKPTSALDLGTANSRSLSTGETLTVTIPAYQLASWRLQGAVVSGGKAKVPLIEMERLRTAYKQWQESRQKAGVPAEMTDSDKRIEEALAGERPAQARTLLNIAPVKARLNALQTLNWRLIGPFDLSLGNVTVPRPLEQGLLQAIPLIAETYSNPSGEPVKQLDVRSGSMTYHEKTVGGAVDVNQYYVPPSLAFAMTNLRCQEACVAKLYFGWDDQGMLWLNGKKLVDETLGMRKCLGWVPDEFVRTVKLQKGDNFVVVKINNGGGPGGFNLYLEDGAGRWPTGVESVLPAAVK